MVRGWQLDRVRTSLPPWVGSLIDQPVQRSIQGREALVEFLVTGVLQRGHDMLQARIATPYNLLIILGDD